MPTARRRDTVAMRRKYNQARRAEIQFAKALAMVAKKCGVLARKTFNPNAPLNSSMRLRAELERYGQTITPWARATAKRMVLDVERRDSKVWFDKSKEMSKLLNKEIRTTPIGFALRERSNEAAALITSLPLEAAQRVEKFAVQYLTQGKRASVLAKQVMATGEVTKGRAMLIARTETSRTASILQQLRAESVGSEGYIWRTVMDIDVRDLHENLEGKFFKWISPPIAGENGERAHPGEIYNCFPGDTLVSPKDGQLRVLRAAYSGPLVVLEAGETKLEVTPNHPILTPRGWVAAGLLQAGDNICKMPFESGKGFKDNVDNRLVPIGEVFESFRANRETSPYGAMYRLYGDISHNEVEVVRTKRDLSFSNDISFAHSFSQYMVANADRWIRGAWAERSFTKIFEALQSGLLDISDFLLFSSSSSEQLIGTSSGASFNAQLFESLTNEPVSDFKLRSQGWNTDTGSIASSDLLVNSEVILISKRSVRDFIGHVYTFETESGHYTTTPAKIIVKNCRCYAEVVLPGERRPRVGRRFVAEAA